MVSKPRVRNKVCSNQFIQWYRLWKINILLYEMAAGKNRVRSEQKRGERDRENGLKEWEMEHRREKMGAGWEMTVGNDTWVFGFNRTNNMSINTDINSFWVISNLLNWVVTYGPLNEASHHRGNAFDYKHLGWGFESIRCLVQKTNVFNSYRFVCYGFDKF